MHTSILRKRSIGANDDYGDFVEDNGYKTKYVDVNENTTVGCILSNAYNSMCAGKENLPISIILNIQKTLNANNKQELEEFIQKNVFLQQERSKR